MNKNSFIEEIKILRSKTNIGFLECKNTLIKTNGSVEEALILLKKNGILKAQNKETRTTSHGLISILINSNENKSIILEINCETDFVAKSKEFFEYTKKTTEFMLYNFKYGKSYIFKDEIYLNKNLNEKRLDFISKIGENICIKRAKYLEENDKIFFGYTHGGINHTGKIGTILTLNENAKKNETILTDLAMQIIATKPIYINISDIPEEILTNEKKIHLNIAEKKVLNKNEKIIKKISDGLTEDFIKENVLLEQNFIKDQSIKVKKIINNNIKLFNFVRFEIGE